MDLYLAPATIDGQLYLAPADAQTLKPAPTASIVSQEGDGGQNRHFVINVLNATSGNYLLIGQNGAANIGPTNFTISDNVADFWVDTIHPATYAVLLTFNGPDGTTQINGEPFTIVGVSGGGSAGTLPPVDPPPVDPPQVPTAQPRFGRPYADIVKGNWQPSSGTSLFDMLDDLDTNTGRYIATSVSTSGEVAIAPVVDPGTSTNQVIRIKVHASQAGGTLVATLKQGTQVIATRTFNDLPTQIATKEMVLTPQECDSITNYANLRMTLTVP